MVEIVHCVKVSVLQQSQAAPVFVQKSGLFASARGMSPERMDDGPGINQSGQRRQRVIHAHMCFAAYKQRTDKPPGLKQVAKTRKLDDKMPGHG